MAECLKYSIEIFGKNKVSSVLIVGLEDIESTLKGCKFLIENDIIPILIPFKPYDNCELSDYPPTDSNIYLQLCQKISKIPISSKSIFGMKKEE